MSAELRKSLINHRGTPLEKSKEQSCIRCASHTLKLSTACNLLVGYVPLFLRRTQNNPDRNCDRQGGYKISHALFASRSRRESLHLDQLGFEVFLEKQINKN
jgi:hypothetical protein